MFLIVILVCIQASTFSGGFAKSCTCGRENIDSRIVGGSRVSEHRYPWMVSLLIQNTKGQYFSCGGSLINNLYVLTAAHCLKNAKRVTATMGTNNRRRGGKKYYVTNTKLNGYNQRTSKNDVALLKLHEPVEFTREINPICLPSADMLNFTQLTVAGWGYTVPGGASSDDLLEVTVNQYPFDKCNREWGYRLDSTQLCAGDYGKSTCGGDSGGPLMVRQRGKMSVVGIVSYGVVKCGSAPNTVYTRVTSFLKWIKDETQDAKYCY